MNDIKWIPLGSVVVWNNSTQKILVIGRGLNVRSDDENEYYFDYCGVVYPEGLIGDRVLYFNHDAVDRILFEGYDDDVANEVVHNVGKTTKSYMDVQSFFPKNGVNIFNASRQTKLTVFPRVTFEEAIRDIENEKKEC